MHETSRPASQLTLALRSLKCHINRRDSNTLTDYSDGWGVDD